MPYRLRRKKSATKNVRKVAREQIDKAIAEIENPSLDRHEAVHQVRKRCKKLRGLIRLVRPSFDKFQDENAFIRDSSRVLSYVRDAQSIIHCLDKLTDDSDKPIDPATRNLVRGELDRRRREIAKDEAGLDLKLDEFRDRMRELRSRMDDWQVGGDGWAVIEGGFRKTYRRGRKAMGEAYADPSPEAFHEWRKRAKYHWYHLRLLRNIWPEMIEVECAAADELADLLGDDHDLAVLRQTLEQTPERFGGEVKVAELTELIERRRWQLEAEARPLGERLYAEKPKRHAARLRCYWKTWRS